MGYLSKRKFEERERYFVTGLLILIPLLTLLGTFGRSLDWRLDWLGEFKIQASLLSAVLVVWCLIKRRWGYALTFLVLAGLNLALIATHYHLIEKKVEMPDDSYTFSLLYQNLRGADDLGDQIRRDLENVQADIVMWNNVPVEIYRNLNDIKGDYTLQNQTFDKRGEMKLILARTPGVDRGEIDNGAGLWVSRVIGTRKFTLVLSALKKPWSEKNYQTAQKQVFDLADFARSRDEPVVVVGMFGATGWSYLLKDMEKHAGLHSQGTVSVNAKIDRFLLLNRPTEHIYTHPGIEVSEMEILDGAGKEQTDILATFKIAPIRKEIEFFEMQPTLPESELLQAPL